MNDNLFLQHMRDASWHSLWFTTEAWAAMTMGAAVPLAVRTLNPGAVMASDHFVWQHQVGKDADGHCIFDSPIYGVRATARLLYIYREHEGLDTILDVIARYSGLEAKPLCDYARFVADRAGVPWCLPFDYHPVARDIVGAICDFETGGLSDAVPVGQVWIKEVVTRGVALSHEW